MSQLDLACDADISTKHLSFLETGRARPSRDMVLRLSEYLDVPLRIRNEILTAAGFEPAFQQRDYKDPALAVARSDVETVLAAHDPNPAVAVDRHWLILSANTAVASLTGGAEPVLLRPPVNLLRLCLHPAGLGSRIVNLATWRAHVIGRLRRQIEITGDTGLVDLLEEIRDYPHPPGAPLSDPSSARRPFGAGPQARNAGENLNGIAIPFQLVTIDGTLSFFSTTTRFDRAEDITLSELSIEAFLPADQQTADILRRSAALPNAPGPVVPMEDERQRLVPICNDRVLPRAAQ